MSKRKIIRKLDAVCELLGMNNFTDYESLGYGVFWPHEKGNENMIDYEKVNDIRKKAREIHDEIKELREIVFSLAKTLNFEIVRRPINIEFVKTKK